MKIKYRKHKKTIIRSFNTYDWDAESGDIMINELYGKIYRLRESSGIWKASRGELSYYEIKPPFPNLHAVLENSEIYWTDEEPTYASKHKTIFDTKMEKAKMIDCRYLTINLKCSHLRKDFLYLVDDKCCLTFPKRTFCKLQMSIPIEETDKDINCEN